jgi:hypothetical protein
MPIIQQQPAELEARSSIPGIPMDPPRDLEYPHPPVRTNTAIPLILWSLALLAGILMLLGHAPTKAPAFEQLTQYVCDPAPLMPGRWGRGQRSPVFTCRSGDSVVYQYGISPYDNISAWKPCRRAGGVIRIWRVAPPSPYGPYLFHATCDDHIITYYRARVAAYESTQQFIIGLSLALISLSAGVLIAKARKHLPLGKTPRSNG